MFKLYPLTPTEYDQCVNIVCGPNAECVNERLSHNSSITAAPNSAASATDLSSASDGATENAAVVKMISKASLSVNVTPLGQCKCLAGHEGNPTNLETGCNLGNISILGHEIH